MQPISLLHEVQFTGEAFSRRCVGHNSILGLSLVRADSMGYSIALQFAKNNMKAYYHTVHLLKFSYINMHTGA